MSSRSRPARLPTLDEIRELLCDEYDCAWEEFGEQIPGVSALVHGGIFRRTVDGQQLEAPYLDQEVNDRIRGEVVRRLCEDLEIIPAEVFDWFERVSWN